MTHPNFELLKEAYAIIGGIPDNRVYLGTICRNLQSSSQMTNPNHCGTVGCALGLLAMHPMFHKLGLFASSRDGVGGVTYMGRRYEPHEYASVAGTVFNMPTRDARDLFCSTHRVSKFDPPEVKPLSDKRLWLARVRSYLKDKGQLT